VQLRDYFARGRPFDKLRANGTNPVTVRTVSYSVRGEPVESPTLSKVMIFPASLAHSAQLPSAQEVHMKVGNFLAGIGTLINYQPIAAQGNALSPGHLLGHHQHMTNKGFLVGANLGQGGQGHDRDYQKMHRSLGINVSQHNNLVVSI
jgi:hypothetical protein